VVFKITPEDDFPTRVNPEAVTLSPPRIPSECDDTEPSPQEPPTDRPPGITAPQAEEILQAIRASEGVIADKVTERLKGFLGDHLLNFRQSVHDETDATVSAISRMLDTKFSELLSEIDRRYDQRITTVKGELDVVAKTVFDQKEVTAEHARKFEELDSAHATNGNGHGVG
jgi:hypothetical protein